MKSYLPLICCVGLAVVLIQSCQAFNVHTQNTFCDPAIDFVIRGKVKKVNTVSGAIKYKVKIKEIFKGLPAFTALPKTTVGKSKAIRTSTACCCTANLVKGTMYVMAGKVIGNQLWISSCDWVQEWNTLNAVEIQNLRTNYMNGLNCQCSVQFITGAQPPFPPPPTACLLNGFQCGRQTWCKCADAGCSDCRFENSPAFRSCEDSQPLRP